MPNQMTSELIALHCAAISAEMRGFTHYAAALRELIAKQKK